MENQKFYQKTWLVILALIFLAPLGVFLMWKYKPWNKALKIILSVVFLIFFFAIAASTQNKPQTENPSPSNPPSVNTPDTSTPTPSDTADFNEQVFIGYVEQDFKTVAVREIVYKPQNGYITVDFDVAEGDYPVVTTQEEAEALALFACSKVANLFEHSKGVGLYPDGTEITFNAYYLGTNIFGFTFAAETIEDTDWLTVTEEDFVELWKDYYVKEG